MLSCLGNYLDKKFSRLPPPTNPQPFIQFLLQVLQSQSLVVSIPVLVTWTRLLSNRTLGRTIADDGLLGALLETCSSRLLRYENLPEDTQDATYLLLLEDTDTIPERHAFLGNYRRYSCQVIENITQLKLADTFARILSQAEAAVQQAANVLQGFDRMYLFSTPLDRIISPLTHIRHLADRYNKNSLYVLQIDASFTVIESALKGYTKWRAASTAESAQDDVSKLPPPQLLARSPRADRVIQNQRTSGLEAEFESWCGRLMEKQVEVRNRLYRLIPLQN